VIDEAASIPLTLMLGDEEHASDDAEGEERCCCEAKGLEEHRCDEAADEFDEAEQCHEHSDVSFGVDVEDAIELT